MSLSGQSASSFGSAATDATDVNNGGTGPNRDGTDDEINASFESGVFGVLYTVSKEKAPSLPFVIFRLFMDWIQVFLLMVNPAYGWNIDPNNKWWQAFSFIQLNYFLSVRGYTFFLILLYIMAIALFANLGLCIWVSNSFKNNKFDQVWPIVWLRYFSLIFYQVLDIASLTLFLVTMDCQYFGVDPSLIGYNQEFPDVYCWQMPHMIHVAVAAAAIVIFFVLATIFSMAEIELNPVSHNLMGMAHTKVEVLGFGIKMAMTCISVFVGGLRWMSVFQLIGAFFLCYLYLKWLPHLHAPMNHVRVGSYFSILWASLLLIILAYQPGIDPDDVAGVASQSKMLTIALWVGFVPVGLVGALLSWLRTRYFLVTIVGKFRDAPANAKAKHIHKFTDPREVEIASRVCRKWLDEDTLDDDGVQLAERIVKAGTKLMPHQPYMTIMWSSFLIDVQGSYQSGYTELQNAKRLSNPSLLERFCLFIREQEHVQKASAATSGDNENVDLLSYVEFQRNYRLAYHLHFEALVARRTFWETLLHRQVTFSKVATAVKYIETSVRASERMYKQVLMRHGSSVKILVLYVKFLKNVRNDPWSAARWSAEAEKLQKMEEETNERAVMGDGIDKGPLQSHDDSKGVIIMGANCLIRMINEPACAMFGFTKQEIVGKNINVIVPPPFSQHHNSYVRNYIETGQSHILGRLREFVALHKDRYVVPIHVFATKVSGVGEDSVFMGIFQRLPIVPNQAMVWVMNAGKVLSCDSAFTNWLGYRHEDLHSKPISDFVVNKEELDQALAVIKAESLASKSSATPLQERAAAPALEHQISTKAGPIATMQVGKGVTATIGTAKAWDIHGVTFKHMYIPDLTVEVDIHITIGGIGDSALHVCKLERSADTTPTLLVTDSRGRVIHATSKLARRLGVEKSALHAGGMMHGLDVLLPAPFAKIHHQWQRDMPDAPLAWSCRSGLSMCLNARGDLGPCTVPFTMSFMTKEIPGKARLNVISLKETSAEQMLDERRLKLVLGSDGRVKSAGASPASLFGFDPQGLVGAHLSRVLDLHGLIGGVLDLENMESEEDATRLLLSMAQRSYDMPGMSWRVGVLPMMDHGKLLKLGNLGAAMMAKRMLPAVMVVDAYLEEPTMDGAHVLLPSEMQLKVELWRTEFLSGVIEVDTQGNVVQLGIKDQPAFSPHLLLGLPPSLLQGAAMSSILSVSSKSLVETLFTPGALAPAPSSQKKAGGAMKGAASVGGRAAKGALRGGSQSLRKRGVGPLHTIKLMHFTDCSELELTVQAVIKQDIGVGCSLYVLMHVTAPRCSRPNLSTWFWSAPPPSLHPKGAMSIDPVSRTGSMLRAAQLAALADAAFAPPAASKHAMHLTFNNDKPLTRRKSVDSTPEPWPMTPTNERLANTAAAEQGVAGIGKAPARKHSEAGSGDSEPLGLKEGGKELIATWIASAEAQLEAQGDVIEDQSLDEDSEEEEEEEDLAKKADEIPEDPDDDNDAADLDEAGTAVNEFKRGKRLKALVKLLMSPQAQAPNNILKWVSIAVVLVLILVDVAMFVTFNTMVTTQVAQVVDLRSAGKAVNRALSICIDISAIGVTLAGQSNPNILHLGKEGPNATLVYLMNQMLSEVEDLETFHLGIFRGFSQLRQLPEAYNLRYLWEEPALAVRYFYSLPNGTIGVTVNASMWDAGAELIKSTRSILQNQWWRYQLGAANASQFANDTDVLFSLYNGPRAIMTTYMDTLDGLMQQSIEDSKKMNTIQLIIVGIEGGFVGFTAVAIIWIFTARLVKQRFTMFSVFLMVPPGMIRGLAAAPFHLDDAEEGQEEEEEVKQDEEEEAGGRGHDPETGSINAKGNNGGPKFVLTTNNAAQETATKPGFLGWLSSFWQAPTTGSKREMQPSLATVLWFTWPFIFWALFVIIINVVGYMMLSNMSAPIAMLNVIQFVSIRAQRVQFYAQRLTSGQYFDPSFTFTAPSVPNGTVSPEKPAYVATLETDYGLLRIEYDAMLLGSSAPSVQNQTSPHFTLVKEGIAFGKAGFILYGATGCMAQVAADCQDPSSSFYSFTNNGLDQMMKEFFFSVESLLKQPLVAMDMTTPEFQYIYEVGNADIFGALLEIKDLYMTSLTASYNSVLMLHIIALVVCCVMGAGFLLFIMRPNFTHVTAEARRVAELLSNLPPEVAVEAMVTQALQINKPTLVKSNDPKAGAGGKFGSSGGQDALCFSKEDVNGVQSNKMSGKALKLQ